jgi:hypothetical protein
MVNLKLVQRLYQLPSYLQPLSAPSDLTKCAGVLQSAHAAFSLELDRVAERR